MKEREWCRICGFEQYEVSNFGEVRSWHKGQPKLLSTPPVKEGSYHAAHLHKGGKNVSVLVHRLVAAAFIPNPDKKPQVNHINGIKSDNRAENLEWCTQSENNLHAFSSGLRAPACGEDNAIAKLTPEQVDYIRQNYKPYVNGGAKLGRKFGVSASTIKSIIQNKSWTTHKTENHE